MEAAIPLDSLNPFSAKYNAGSNKVFRGNLANLVAASATPAMKPGTRTEAPLSPEVCTLGIWEGSPSNGVFQPPLMLYTLSEDFS